MREEESSKDGRKREERDKYKEKNKGGKRKWKSWGDLEKQRETHIQLLISSTIYGMKEELRV